jgi:hypothetical protein
MHSGYEISSIIFVAATGFHHQNKKSQQSWQKLSKKTISLKKKYNFFSRSNFTRSKKSKNEKMYFFFDNVFFFDKSNFPHTGAGSHPHPGGGAASGAGNTMILD